MSFAEIFPMMLRRWYVVVFAVILGGAAGLLGFAATPASYEAHAQVLLLPSAAASGDTKGPGNPYLALSNSLGETAQIAAARAADASTATELLSAGYTATYTVIPDTSLNAPVVLITATGRDKAVADQTMRAVVAKFQSLLTTLQTDSGAPANTLISTATVTETPTPNKLRKTPIRNGIGAGVLGLVIGLIPLFIVERRSRRHIRTAIHADTEVGSAEATDDAAVTAPTSGPLPAGAKRVSSAAQAPTDDGIAEPGRAALSSGRR